MRTWARALIACRCGLCEHEIPRGAPLLRLAVPSLTRVLLRGSCCVPAPADLPPLVEPRPIDPRPFVHVASGPETLPLDFKARASGEREPGEDG